MGLISAAGHPRRLGVRSMSKEVRPLGWGARRNGATGIRGPVHSLLRACDEAGADHVLGRFPACGSSRDDLIDSGAQRDVRSMVVKPALPTPAGQANVHFGHGTQTGLDIDLCVSAGVLDGAYYANIGRPGDLQTVLR